MKAKQPKAPWVAMKCGIKPSGAAKPKDNLRLKRKSWPNAISDRRRREGLVYRQRRATYLKFHPLCQAPGCEAKATEIHHMRGRAGKLFTDSTHWKALCSDCHRYVTRNPKWARSVGLLCAEGEWGKQS